MSVVGGITPEVKLRQRPRSQSQRIVRQMHIAAERTRIWNSGTGQSADGQEVGILLQGAEGCGVSQCRGPRQLHVAGCGELLQGVARRHAELSLSRAWDDGQIGV